MPEVGGLLATLLVLIDGLRPVFLQERTFLRARRLLVSHLLVMGTRQISRAIMVAGRDRGQDWSADYRLFSRAEWNLTDLFRVVLERALTLLRDSRYVLVALDETVLRRVGKTIPGAGWLKDALSPPFNVNLIWGCRALQASLIIPFYRWRKGSLRGIPVAFQLIPKRKKPGKKASPDQIAEYKRAQRNSPLLTTAATAMARQLREQLDRLGVQRKRLLIAADGSFACRKFFGEPIDNVDYLVRFRKDARLCFPANEGSRVYALEKFTPEGIRKNGNIKWQKAKVFHAGRRHTIRFKQVKNVLWQKVSQKRLVRAIVIEALPYGTKANGGRLYRQPAYLLSTDLKASPAFLVQCYFDRWEIEVNHRDEKQQLGVQDAQVWSEKSVSRQPGFVVAAYSLLLLASIEAYGPKRTRDFPELPDWRDDKPHRPSCRDILMKLREEAADTPDVLEELAIRFTLESLTRSAA